MKLSLVTTLYHSAPYLKEFYERARRAIVSIDPDYEMIFVVDGSPDNSRELALELLNKDSKIKVIDLSRNFGHHKAIMTGLAHAQGERVFLLDSDLEEEPEWLLAFDEAMKKMDADVVYGVQQSRKGGWIEASGGAFYYWMFNRLSAVPVPANLVTARLMLRPYVEALLEHKEREICISGLWAATGFRQIPVKVHKRDKGRSVYTLTRRWANFVDGITSFSNKPLVYIFYLGGLLAAMASLAALYIVMRRLFWAIMPRDGTMAIVSIWLLGGLILLSLGVIGIYLSKVLMETKQRPYTIIRKIYGNGAG